MTRVARSSRVAIEVCEAWLARLAGGGLLQPLVVPLVDLRHAVARPRRAPDVEQMLAPLIGLGSFVDSRVVQQSGGAGTGRKVRAGVPQRGFWLRQSVVRLQTD